LKEKEEFKRRKASLGQPQLNTNTPPRSSTPANLSGNSTVAATTQHKRSASQSGANTVANSPLRSANSSNTTTTSKTVPNTPQKSTKS